MLQAFNKVIMGWLGWVVIGLIIMTFTLFGLGSYLQDESGRYAAKVNESEISLGELQMASQMQRARFEQAMGEGFDPNLIDTQLIRNLSLQGLIRQRLLLEAARDSGMTVSDELLASNIRAIPDLKVDQKFSEDRYRQLLFQRGQTVAGFESETRRLLAVQQLLGGVKGTAFATARETNEAYVLQNQMRDFAYLTVSAVSFEKMIVPDETQITQYYETHADEFMKPAQVKLQFVRLSAIDLADTVEIDEADALSHYEDNKEALRQQEQRRASHILIIVDDEVPDEDALRQAEMLRKKIVEGADFAKLAQENSKDPGSSKQGGDLGFFARGDMVSEFDETVFAMQVNELSEVVKSQFGYHIIRLDEVQSSKIPDFPDVKDELIAELKQSAADEQFYELLERLTDLSYENPESLTAAAEDLALDIKTTEWLSATGGEGIGRYPKVLLAAFSEDVLETGNNSEPIEVSASDVIVLRVFDREPSARMPEEDVKERLIAALKVQQAQEKARTIGEELIERVRNGEELDQLAKQDYLSYRIVDAGKRGDVGNDPEVSAKVFKLPKPEMDKNVDTSITKGNGDYVIIQLTSVKTPEIQAKDGADSDAQTDITELWNSVEVDALVGSLRGSADIKIPANDE